METLEWVNGHRPKEIEVIIIWDADHRFIADKYLDQWVQKGLIRILVNTVVHLSEEKEKEFAFALYGSYESRAINRKFYLVIIEDQNPVYEWMKATSCHQVLNHNIFIIKDDLRQLLSEHDRAKKSIYFYVHTSYNTEEAELALRALDYNLIDVQRKIFDDFGHFFSTINRHPRLMYIIQRSFHDLENEEEANEKDVDVLVNDYYLFKEITGARSLNKKLMREREDGYFIQNEIMIGGKALPFDIRYLGDNFQASNFELDTLQSRRLQSFKNFDAFVPNNTYHLYTLLYNVLIQKPNVYKRCHIDTLNSLYQKLDRKIEFDFSDFETADKKPLWQDLSVFMKSHKYKIVKPKDKNVKLNIPLPYRHLFEYDGGLYIASHDIMETERTTKALKYLKVNLQSDAPVVLVDEAKWDVYNQLPFHEIYHFLERDGMYWGMPHDDAQAISELEKLKTKGAHHLVVLWWSFWWLDHYIEWAEYIKTNCTRVYQDDSIQVYQL